MITRLGWIILVWVAVVAVSTHREHKVHNIVLYPDKHSWCKRTPIKQVIGQSGCQSVEVENNVCVGGCFSYSIPRTEPTAPGQVAPYCDSCQPLHVTWKHVTLKCDPTEVEGGKATKRVEVIEECSCMSCSSPLQSSNHWYHQQGEQYQPAHMADTELIDLQDKANFTSFPTSGDEDNRRISTEKLSVLLKVLGGSNDDLSAVDREALNHVLHRVLTEEHDHRSAIDHNTLHDDDISPVESWKIKEHLKLDMVKLKEYLGQGPHLEEGTHNRHHSRHHAHGPHHSKVLIPDDFPNPTLDMEPHHLKPAVEGSEIAYHADTVSMSPHRHN